MFIFLASKLACWRGHTEIILENNINFPTLLFTWTPLVQPRKQHSAQLSHNQLHFLKSYNLAEILGFFPFFWLQKEAFIYWGKK